MIRKKWIFPKPDKNEVRRISEELDLDYFSVLVLYTRGMTSEDEIYDFLNSDEVELSDPFLLKDMDKAVERITKAIENEEKICVFGDYDCDGVTSTALLVSYLESVGADVIYYIPSRLDEGYGLNVQAVDDLNVLGVKLIITVDNGISAVDEVKHINELGMSIVVTDHHQPGEVLPSACAVVNPHRSDDESPFKDLAGVGVAFKLVSALEGGDCMSQLDDFSDLAALGTIADVVPLLGENRVLVVHGLKGITHGSRPGIAALAEAAYGGSFVELDSSSVAFRLCPRINAAGRLGDADSALKLLLSESESVAEILADDLNNYNTERQKTENEILEQAIAIVESSNALKYSQILVVNGKDWHSGVVGIVAARLTEKYAKPAIVLSDGDNGESVGSCRSIKGFHLYKALTELQDMLIKFGGHELAAGLTLRTEDIPLFREKINRLASDCGIISPQISIDCKLKPPLNGTSLVGSIELLEPFGAQNPHPLVAFLGVTVNSVRPLGQEGKHVRVVFERDSASIEAVCFGVGTDAFPARTGELVDIAVTVEKREFRGKISADLFLKSIRPHDADDEKYFKSMNLYSKIKRGDPLSDTEKFSARPTRDFVSRIYKAVKICGVLDKDYEQLAIELTHNSGYTCMVRITLDALVELGLLKCSGRKYKIAENAGKVSLTSSSLLSSLDYSE